MLRYFARGVTSSQKNTRGGLDNNDYRFQALRPHTSPGGGAMTPTLSYIDFIARKQQLASGDGFEPVTMPDFLFDFQRSLVEWALRRGRAAIFADCGLGKTPMQLVWADNVARKTGGRVLILTPLAVAAQTHREAEKFGLDCEVSRNGTLTSQIVATNYERLHYFDPDDFSGVVCDESSAIKNFDGKRTAAITEFMRRVKYRLLCTATAAPNDFVELGTSSEALGYMGFRDMITMFFKQETGKDHLGWGRTKYRFRGHAEHPFWKWVCSWARAIRKPSDLGFSNTRFKLPPLHESEMVVETSTPRSGMLFSTPAENMREEREERRITINERCDLVANSIDTSQPAVVWCHLNDEGDLLTKQIKGAAQVKGSMDDDEKEEVLKAFGAGEIKTLVTKPKIGCWGLNWQHCNQVFTFPSHSFEQYYQAVRRCWRFGQKRPVHVRVIATRGEVGITENLKRKSRQSEQMFQSLVKHMVDEMAVSFGDKFNQKECLPSWL